MYQGKFHNSKQYKLRKFAFLTVFFVLSALFVACTYGVQHNSAQPKSSTSTVTTNALNHGWKTLWNLPTLDSPLYQGTTLLLKPSIAWSPAASQTLYLCRVALNYVTPAPANALTVFYRSDDLGQHWLALPLPEPAASCAIKTDPTAKDTIVLLDNRDGRYVSRDQGQHWFLIPSPPGWEKVSTGDMNIQSVGNRLYVGSYWTSDSHTWVAWSPSPGYNQHPQIVAVNPNRQNILYTSLSTCSGSPTDQVEEASDELCRSDDNGKTWHYLHTLALTRDPSAPRFCLASDNSSVIYAWGKDIGSMSSNDEGHTWTPLPNIRAGQFDGSPFELCGSITSGEDISTRVDIQIPNQDRQYQFAITNNGTLYHATQQAETLQGTTIPAGITAWNNNQWQQIAPPPLQIDSDIALNTSVLWLTTKSGYSLLLAFDRDHVYYYTE